MSKKNIDYDALLRMFVLRSDTSRFAITAPYNSGEWSCATNGHYLCAVPHSMFRGKYNTENVPALEKLTNAAKWLDEPRQLSISSLIHKPFERESLPVEPVRPEIVKEKCSTCDGTGYCECDCQGEHSCSKCHGRGERKSRASEIAWDRFIAEQDAYRKAIGREKTCRIFDSTFNYHYLRTVREAVAMLGEKQMSVLAQGPQDVFITEASGVRFFLMPLISGSGTDFVDLNKKIEAGAA